MPINHNFKNKTENGGRMGVGGGLKAVIRRHRQQIRRGISQGFVTNGSISEDGCAKTPALVYPSAKSITWSIKVEDPAMDSRVFFPFLLGQISCGCTALHMPE